MSARDNTGNGSKRKWDSPAAGGTDSGSTTSPAKRPKTDTTNDDKADEAARQAAEFKRIQAQVAARMASLTKSGLLPATAAAPKPSNATPPPAASATVGGINISEISARIARQKEQLLLQQQQQQQQAAASSSSPANVDRAKRGLKMEYHPSLVFDTTGQLNIRGGAKAALMPKADFATVRANQRSGTPGTAGGASPGIPVLGKDGFTTLGPPSINLLPKKEMKIETASPDFADPTKNPYFDPNLAAKAAAGPRERARKGFRFVQQGRFINEANQLRSKAQLEKLKRDIAESVKKTGMAVEMELVADQSMRTEPPPPVEWWDAPLAPDGYANFNPGPLSTTPIPPTNLPLLTALVQHPIPIQPPAESSDPKPKPLMLTKKETKKLRRQRRMELQKEKREKIRLGLLPPEQSKVKISNFMRVLGTEAVQDPTQIEATVRAQMAARKQKDRDLVAANKLTDAQRKDKKRRKLDESEVTDTLLHVAVFRINDLSHPQHKFKVDMNAQQHNLTGCAILHAGSNLVVVEGGPKGIKAYKKLMLKRIDWVNTAPPAGESSSAPQEDDTQDKPPNECILVWEGQVKERNFKGFRFRPLPTERGVREYLEKCRCVHYWDAARNWVKEGF
ncbi:pre-mRNA processing factor 3-domain-containing protein [Fimicolochytrium jonesii]|uniref:pre-mRNA processing factor 3-domain-containing protein n=1 Tax=Fimicolochytrium jonesii TaxID=1396493 RepID=UPI0022FED8EA|nr:pre-mRNA processing factor 3-domain-containing protein [Fimicolochytrium jonesii]KAI8825592.1 pre-mRNA processing factor 3-domain-containing protein [Fimicolochytrium jonesii]